MKADLTPREEAERDVKAIFRKYSPKLKAAIRAMIRAGGN